MCFTLIFSIFSIGVVMSMPARDFLNAGWINRIRVKEEKNKYTITYKKRYPVQDDDMEAALAAARDDGFSLYDEQFLAPTTATLFFIGSGRQPRT